MSETDEVIEVEVERLPSEHAQQPTERARRLRRAFGPVLAGLVIDLVDFATIGPLQTVVGLPLGTVLGWQMFRYFSLPTRYHLGFALACGLYCGLLPTNYLPFATLLGAFARVLWPDTEARA